MIMKKVIFAISMLAVAFGFTACSNEDEAVNNAKKGKATVVAFTENETRTALSGDDTKGYQVVWSEGDKITIDGNVFTLTEGVNKTAAKFSGTAPAEGTYNALYGIDELVWPAVQTYKEGNVANFPMYASATVDSEGNISPLSFKNLGGLLRLTVMGESTRKIKSIEVASDNPMAGTFTMGRKDYAAKISTNKSFYRSIILDCGSNGVALSSDGTDFYIALPSFGYTGVKIYLTSTDGNVCVKTFKGQNGLTITRSQITKASFTVEETEFVTGITAKSPVGTVGLLNMVEGMVVELNGTNVVIATKNVGATTIAGDAGSENIDASCYGTLAQKTDLDGKIALGGAGWRLPTVDELNSLKEHMVWNGSRHGVEWKVTDESTLYIPAAGAMITNPNSTPMITYYQVGNIGLYWSSLDNLRIFEFDQNAKSLNEYNPISNKIKYYYRIRAFHDMPTE